MQYMNEGMPRVSYTKAIDVWMSVCLFFIFLSMCEYAVAHVFLQYEEAEAEQAKAEQFSYMSLGTTQAKDPKRMSVDSTRRKSSMGTSKQYTEFKRRETQLTNILHKMEQREAATQSSVVDKISRWLFPGSFFVFAVIYSIVYSVADPAYTENLANLLEIAC